MKQIFLGLILGLIFVCGCQKSEEGSPATPPPQRQIPPAKATSPQPAAALNTTALLRNPIQPTLVELPTAALPVWREARGNKPALVFLSQDPFLAPIPEQVRAEALNLVQDGTKQEMLTRVATPAADPLLLPSMALSAALEAGFFSRVVWVLPSKGGIDELQLKTFQEQLLGLGAVDQAEAASFTQTVPGTFAGTVRGVPFQAVHLDALPAIEAPIVLHLDLSYFLPLYQGEIKTPLYPLLAKTHLALRDKQWQAVAVTLSASNLNGVIPLASRFVAADAALIYREPGVLDGAMPPDWDTRARALYLENFFKKEEVRVLYEEMEQRLPKDASVKYALYQVLRQFKEGDKALVKLQEAVKLDKVYALEYLALADVAKEQNLPAQVQRMLTLANEAFPGNVFMQLRMAGFLKASGHAEMAEKLLADLRKQSWSAIYYPDMAKQLE